jgi:hypothetical protein
VRGLSGDIGYRAARTAGLRQVPSSLALLDEHLAESKPEARMRLIRIGIGVLCPLALAVAVVGSIGGQENQKKSEKAPTPAQRKIAEAISKGHSYQKHVIDEELFPEVKSQAEFAKLIAGVLANPTHARELSNDREAFYDQATNTLVLVNPHAKDRGTCFRPSAKKRYYDNLK